MNNFKLFFEESIKHIKVCAACEKEFGPIKTDLPKTHGACRRHLIGMYGEYLKGEELQQKIQYINNLPDDAFPPDLSKNQITESTYPELEIGMEVYPKPFNQLNYYFQNSPSGSIEFTDHQIVVITSKIGSPGDVEKYLAVQKRSKRSNGPYHFDLKPSDIDWARTAILHGVKDKNDQKTAFDVLEI